jgi:hypothetical protein
MWELEQELAGLTLVGKGGSGAVFRAVWQGAQVVVKFMLGAWCKDNAYVCFTCI